MAQYSNEQLFEAYKKLPKDIQEAITGVNTSTMIQALGNKYSLTSDKITNLADQTGLVMLGLSPAKDFIINIARNVYIDKETARKIAADINTQIFSKIRDSLKKIHGTLGEEETKIETPPPFFSQKISPPPLKSSSQTLPSFTSIPIETVPPKPVAPSPLSSVPAPKPVLPKPEPLPVIKPTPLPSTPPPLVPPPPPIPPKPSVPPPPIAPSSPVKLSEAIDKEKILKEIEKPESPKPPEQKKYAGGSDPYREPI